MLRYPLFLLLFSVPLLQSCGVDSATADTTPVAEASLADGTEITVYKSPTCGCCSLWIEHLEANGFTVQAVDMENVNSVKDYYGIPSNLSSCHTGVVEGYAIEGHVPAEDIVRLLEERPDAIGLTVPGMPIGSPGMEVEGRPADNYDVILVSEEGTSVYASH